jgi:hypothetical protein
MTEEVTGIWEGRLDTMTAPPYAAYGGTYGGPREIRGSGGPQENVPYDARLTITSQGDYRKLGTKERWVSTISGELEYVNIKSSDPVSGFVDDSGMVNLIIYNYWSLSDCTFAGLLTTRGLVRDISGNLLSRRSEWPGDAAWGWIDYGFGTLSVKKYGLNVDYYTHVVNYGHVF